MGTKNKWEKSAPIVLVCIALYPSSPARLVDLIDRYALIFFILIICYNEGIKTAEIITRRGFASL